MRERVLKWSLPALVVIQVALIRLEVLDFGDAVLVVVLVEALLLIVGARQMLAALRNYRRGRSAGLDLWAAVEDGLSALLPRPAARLVVSEPRLFVCLTRWALRRARLKEGEFGYHRRSNMGEILPMIVVVSPVELLLVHLLAHIFSPWAWLKWALLILGVYAIFWLLGFYASLVTLPHRLEKDGLLLRHGVFAEAFFPYPEIEGVEHKARPAPGWGDGLRMAPGEDAAYLAINGETNLTLRLRKPRKLQGFFRSTGPVTAVHLAADEPERLARELERRIEAARLQEKSLTG